VNAGALKFEAVPYHHFAGLFGLHQALKNIHAVGPAAIYARLRAITDELVEGLNSLGGRVVSPRGEHEWSGIISFAPRSADAGRLAAKLNEHGVYVARRKGRLRICPHYYNTSAEVRKFLSLLRDLS
jgi:selenocysteine lyase/cysteine desulfurase